jgi:hypothetical protein
MFSRDAAQIRDLKTPLRSHDAVQSLDVATPARTNRSRPRFLAVGAAAQ